MGNNVLVTMLVAPGYAMLVAPGYAMLVAPGYALEKHDPERPMHNTGERDEVKRNQPGLRIDARAVPHGLKTPENHA